MARRPGPDPDARPPRGEKAPTEDAFAGSAFQVNDFRRNDWAPPLTVRTTVWLVKDVGVPVVLSGILIAVILGWVDSPLSRITKMDLAVQQHVDQSNKFQGELLESLRKQRCSAAVTALSTNINTIVAAALSVDPCFYLESMRRGIKE